MVGDQWSLTILGRVADPPWQLCEVKILVQPTVGYPTGTELGNYLTSRRIAINGLIAIILKVGIKNCALIYRVRRRTIRRFWSEKVDSFLSFIISA